MFSSTFKQGAVLAAVLTAVSCAGAQSIMMVNVQATLEKTIDAKKAKAGDSISAKVSSAVQLSDGTKVPAGSMLEGHIDSVTPSDKKSDSTLTLTFDKLHIKNGDEIAVKTTLVSISSTAPLDEDKPFDPSSYRAGTAGDNKANGQNGRDAGFSVTPHPIDGLSVAGSPKDAASATLTQAKKNVQLSSGVHMNISVAAALSGANPAGASPQ